MKLSIIIPVYNVSKYLAKCLDSVIDTGLTDYEIICVNDGSTDGSDSILNRYKADYPELIKVINQENKGLSEARNNAIKNAAGEYVFLLDSDDYLDEGSVGRIIELIETDADMILVDFRAIGEDGKFFSQSKTCKENGFLSFKNHPELMFTMPTGAFKKSLFIDNQIYYPSGKLYEDLSTMPKLYLCTNTIYYADIVIYNYIQRSGSIMNSSNIERNCEIMDALNSVVDYYKANNSFDTFFDELEYLCYYNQYITTIVRICKIDSGNNLIKVLQTRFLQEFPNYKLNHYVHSSPIKIKMLDFMISKGLYKAVGLIMGIKAKI